MPHLPRDLRSLLLCLTLFASTVSSSVVASPATAPIGAAHSPNAQDPKTLVVLLVVDQLQQQALSLYRDRLLEPEALGLRFLAERGVEHRHAYLDHYPTHTALGHAAVSTGALPSVHGVVANSWLKPEDSAVTDSGFDPEYPLVGAGPGRADGFSPRVLRAQTLGDVFKLATNGSSRVVGVSLKDRGAVLSTGASADLALWYDSKSGNWVSSRYYAPDGTLPDFAERLNRQEHPDRDFGMIWEPEYYGPETAPANVRSFEQRSGRTAGLYGIGPSFPHQIKGTGEAPGTTYYTLWSYTPRAVDANVALALDALEYYQMGRDKAPDLLSVSFSTLDKLGHAFGPNSPEAFEMVMVLDRAISRLLGGVDRAVGLENCLIALTSDHGVLALPEHQQELGIAGERIDTAGFLEALESRLQKELPQQTFRLVFADPYLYLRGAEDAPEIRQRALDAVADEARRYPGVHDALFRDELLAGRYRPGTYEETVARSLHRRQSGDLVFLPEPGRIFGFLQAPGGTHHGTPWTYDTHVPLLLWGWPGAQGTEDRWCTTRQIPASIAHYFGWSPPSGSDVGPFPWALQTVERKDEQSKAHPPSGAQQRRR